MSKPTLFTPVRFGAIEAPNRMVMAPMTRMRAGAERVPTASMAEYYTQRASAGLIVTEATAISQQGTGCVDTPGLWTNAHVEGWRTVVDAVHAAGGRIFSQLWHMGRISHPSFQADGALPVAPSAIAPRKGEILTAEGMQPYVAPRALEHDELPGIVEQYVAAAERAKLAGFDGVEIHNANGYLLDQFLRDGTNHRTDEYGGSAINRARLTLEVAEAVGKVWGSDRVGIRFSPGSAFNDMRDAAPSETFRCALHELNRLHLAYVHVIASSDDDVRHGAVPVVLTALRRECRTRLIVNNSYTLATANQALAENVADAVSFGRLFLANPDLPERFQVNGELNAPDPSTFYGGGSAGYTDYPKLGSELAGASNPKG